MRKTKAIIIDLDGTLINDNKEVSKDDLRTLKILGKNNITRIIATGRSLFSFYEVFDDKFPIDYLIFDAGAGIIDFKTKELISLKFINSNDVTKIAKRLYELKLDFQIRDKIPYSHKYTYKIFSKENTDFNTLNAIYKKHISELSNFDNFKEATRFICISKNTAIIKQIETEFNEFSIIRATSPVDRKSIWMEIYPTGVNKGSSLIWLCNRLNISLKKTIGLGNDYNDIDFLDICEISFVVANAPEFLKKKYLKTSSNNDSPLSFINSINLFNNNFIA